MDVPEPFLINSAGLKSPLGPSETLIPYSTSSKNEVFKVSTCKTPLGRLLEGLWSTWERPRSLSWRPLGDPLANLTGVPASKIHFFAATRGVPLISCLRRPSGEAFGCYLEGLFAVQSCFFTVIFVVRSRIFRSLSEGHCGRCAVHFSHALEAFCFSAKRLDDVGVFQMCRSAIPLTWVTCRDNMSVCAVMLLPIFHVYSATVGLWM